MKRNFNLFAGAFLIGFAVVWLVQQFRRAKTTPPSQVPPVIQSKRRS